MSILIPGFEGDLVVPTDPGYPAAISRWAANAQRNAAVVAFVKNEKDVGLALAYALSNKLPVAVRGGGHSAAGASSVERGLIVDLSRYLAEARVDPEQKLVYVGGGALWETVDKEAIKYGLATVGGTVNHTGVGGLLLAGGFGWLTGAHGLVIDNLVQATLVLADGSVVTASETKNPDLFWAIRGGGGNFGVATEFVLRVHPQRRNVYAGLLLFDTGKLEQVVNYLSEWFPTAGENESILQLTIILPDGKPLLGTFIFYNGSEAEGREKYKELFALGPVLDQSKEIPYEDLNALQNPMLGHGKGVYMKGLAQSKPHISSALAAYEKVLELPAAQQGISGGVVYEYFPLTKVAAVPQDSTAFPRSSNPNVLVTLFWGKDEPGKTEQARQFANDIHNILVNPQKELLPTGEELGYSNYDPEAVLEGSKTLNEVNEKTKKAFGNKYTRLQEIKKKYDPTNVFHRWFAIQPASD